MKAILLIDMPKSCWACPLWDKSDYADGCEAVGRKTHDINHGAEREVWCPLKPLPQKKEVEVNEIEDIMHTEFSIKDIYTNKYIATIRLATDKLISLGWNACLKEITGE